QGCWRGPCIDATGRADTLIEALLPIRRGRARAMLCEPQYGLVYGTREQLARASRLLSRPTGRSYHDDMWSETERSAPALRGICPARGLRLTGQIRRSAG